MRSGLAAVIRPFPAKTPEFDERWSNRDSFRDENGDLPSSSGGGRRADRILGCSRAGGQLAEKVKKMLKISRAFIKKAETATAALERGDAKN